MDVMEDMRVRTVSEEESENRDGWAANATVTKTTATA